MSFDPEGWATYEHKGKRVGRISKDGKRYATTRVRHIHYVRRYDGYGLQRSILRDLVARGVEWVELCEVSQDAKGRSGARRIRLSPSWWLSAGFTDVLHEGDGAQVFLSMRQIEKAAIDA